MKDLCLFCRQELIAGDDVVDLTPGTLMIERDPDCEDISWMARKAGIDSCYAHEDCLKAALACLSIRRPEKPQQRPFSEYDHAHLHL